MLDDEEFERRRWRVAVLDDEVRRPDLVEFLRLYREFVAGWDFVGTERSAGDLRADAGLRARAGIPDAWWKDLRLQSWIASGDVDALIILIDPLGAHASEPDIRSLLRVADVLNLPVATNLSSARCLVLGLGPARRTSYATL